MMIKMYPLEWFDSLITNTFNPVDRAVLPISKLDTKMLCDRIISESNKIEIQLKDEIFSLKSKRRIRMQVRKYHSILVFFLDTVVERRKNKFFSSKEYLQIFNVFTSVLNDLLSFLETRFSTFISLDQRVPQAYLAVWKVEIKNTLESLVNKKEQEEYCHEIGMLVDIVVLNLNHSENIKLTYRNLQYYRTLIQELNNLNFFSSDSGCLSSLDLLLIRLNFNSVEYSAYLTAKINDYLLSSDNLIERLEITLSCFLKVSQINSNLKLKFDPYQENLKNFLDYWLTNEIRFLEKKNELTFQEQSGAGEGSQLWKQPGTDKLQCILSADQIGIILRATDESRIIKAKSMNYLFKSIIPFLSTPARKNLSYQSVRSKSYNAEDRDKEIAIENLEKIIQKIKTF